MSKTAVIKSNIDSFECFFLDILKRELPKDVDVFGLYKKGVFTPLLLKSSHVLSFPGEDFCNNRFLGDWVQAVQKYNTVILFDNGANPYVIALLRKNNPKARLIFWNWNSGLDAERHKLLQQFGYEIWSFDKKDCRLLGFRYNIQFFTERIADASKSARHDFVFVGRDKQRFALLSQLDKILEKASLTRYIRVITVSPKNCLKSSLYSMKNISYRKILAEEMNCRCIIDIVKEGQEGLTLRVLEALFLNKKLLTNNPKVKELDFYDSNNILSFQTEITAEEILAFLNRESRNVSSTHKEKYSVRTWFDNFCIE